MCFGSFFFFFNHTAPTEIYTYLHTLSLLDALPIYRLSGPAVWRALHVRLRPGGGDAGVRGLPRADGGGAAALRRGGAAGHARAARGRVRVGRRVLQDPAHVDPPAADVAAGDALLRLVGQSDRKSTRLNSSH